jgi:hypothetical protein
MSKNLQLFIDKRRRKENPRPERSVLLASFARPHDFVDVRREIGRKARVDTENTKLETVCSLPLERIN